MENKTGKITRGKHFTAVLFASIIAFLTVATVSGYGLGYNLFLDGVYVATLATEAEAEAVSAEILEEDGIDISSRVRIVADFKENRGFTTVDVACENCRRQDGRFTLAYTLYVDDKSVFSLKTLEDVTEVKNLFLNQFNEEGTESINYTKPVSVEEGYVLRERITDKEEAFRLMEEHADVESLVKLSFYKAIPYKTIVLEDEELYEGVMKTETEGITGEVYVEHSYRKINGVLVEEFVSGETTITDVRDEVIRKGTKVRPKGVATGTFVNPAEGVLTSPFGPRWGRMHKGIDIAAPVGTPMYAADGGTVIYAEWMSGYGYLVQVDHGNGYVTYYAHCSALHVKSGEKVSQGDLIADMGSTGNSSGSHLHFEVRYHNEPQNPLNYVKY